MRREIFLPPRVPRSTSVSPTATVAVLSHAGNGATDSIDGFTHRKRSVRSRPATLLRGQCAPLASIRASRRRFARARLMWTASLPASRAPQHCAGGSDSAFSCRPALEHAGRPRDRSAPWTVDRRILGTIVIDRRSSDDDNALILRFATPCREV